MKTLPSTDVLIIGGGWTGLTMARELTGRSAVSVLVLERGSLPEPAAQPDAPSAGGPAALVWQAAARLGIDAAAAEPVADAGLAEFVARVRFRPPLVRSVVYQSAPAADQRQAHGALAELSYALDVLKLDGV